MNYRQLGTEIRHISGDRFFDPSTWKRFEEETGLRIEAFPQGVAAALSRFQELQRAPMEQLAEWADIGPGTRVCSVGGGWGYEEAVFFARGANVTILDVDEYHVLQPLAEGGYLAMDTVGNRTGTTVDRTVELIIGDFAAGIPGDRTFDAVYVSSLTPNDLRLGEMIRMRGRTIVNGLINRGAQLAGMLVGRKWRFYPPWEDPILPTLLRFAESVLAPGGRLLIKCYACPPVTRSRWYVPAVERQLLRSGLVLVSMVRNEAVHQRHAMLAVKDGSPAAEQMIERIQSRGQVVDNLSVRDANPHRVREIYSRKATTR